MLFLFLAQRRNRARKTALIDLAGRALYLIACLPKETGHNNKSNEESLWRSKIRFARWCLIPAYKPDERLVQLTREPHEEKLDVLLVDDGGQQAFGRIFFDECRALGAEVAVHAVNQGKGRALKTGLNAALNLWPDLFRRVTADADGQHTLRDILRIIEAMREHSERAGARFA